MHENERTTKQLRIDPPLKAAGRSVIGSGITVQRRNLKSARVRSVT
jgi:hypothetical protein